MAVAHQSRTLMSVSGDAGRVNSPSFWWMPEMDLRRVMARAVLEMEATISRSFEGSSMSGDCGSELWSEEGGS